VPAPSSEALAGSVDGDAASPPPELPSGTPIVPNCASNPRASADGLSGSGSPSRPGRPLPGTSAEVIMVRLGRGLADGDDGAAAGVRPISAFHTSLEICATAAALRGSRTEPGGAEVPGRPLSPPRSGHRYSGSRINRRASRAIRAHRLRREDEGTAPCMPSEIANVMPRAEREKCTIIQGLEADDR
jgi:hypothetical protein